MLMYDYLVAYKFKAKGYITTNDGTMTISRKNKIDSIEELELTRKFIEDSLIKHGYEEVANVGIYNLVLLGRNNR